MRAVLKDQHSLDIYNSLQLSRKQARRLATLRCNAVNDLYVSATAADSFKIHSERDTLGALREKLRSLDSSIENLFAIPQTEEQSKDRDEWADRCMEYEVMINEALGKLQCLSDFIQQAAHLGSNSFTVPETMDNSTSSLPHDPSPEELATKPTEDICSATNPGCASTSSDERVHPQVDRRPIIVKREERLPKFSGDAKRYKEWFEQFELAVAGRSSLEKFRSLKNSLTGDALKAISHLSLVEEEYESAIAIVKEEFGNIFSAQYSHVVDIMKLCNGRTFKNADKWQILIPAVSQNVKALKASSENFNDSAVVLLPFILESLPISVKEAFLRGHEYSPTDKPIDQLEAFLKFAVRERKIKTSFHSVRERVNSEGAKVTSNSKPDKGTSFSPRSKENSSFLASHSNENERSCLFCSLSNHESSKCRKNLTNEERLELVQQAGACVICLSRLHRAPKCRSKMTCKSCHGGHNSLLCLKKKPAQTATTMLGVVDVLMESSPSTSLSSGSELASFISSEAHLPTGYVLVSSGQRPTLRRILLDPGSQRSFITLQLARTLQAREVGREMLVTHTLGGNSSEVEEFPRFKINLTNRFDNSSSIEIVCLGIKVITKTIFPPAPKIRGVSEYADHVDNPHSDHVDILIGTNDLGLLWLNDSISDGKLIAWKTRLGWFTFGKKASFGQNATVCHCAFDSSDDHNLPDIPEECDNTISDMNTRNDIDFLFRTEILGIEPPEDDDISERKKYDEIFKGCIRRLPCGRYSLKLPFNEKLQSLGSNEGLARSRLKNLIDRSSLEILKAADLEISNYLKCGFAEEAAPRRAGEFAHYLALQIVKKPAPGTSSGFRIRLVKDASARMKSHASLNDILHTGPNLLPNILNVLTRFRNDPIVVIADIEKAFHQFQIDEKHRTFLRFFWRPNISENPNAPIKEFWAKCLDFGLVCSPWLHQAGVKHHLDNEKYRCPRKFDLIEEIQYTIYMDDLSFGALNPSEGRYKTKDCIEIFELGHFPLKKWACNSRRLAETLEDEFSDREMSVKFDDENFKFLGIRWNQISDSLGVFSAKAVQELRKGTPTKRRLLSGLAKTYDPLGLLSPVLIEAKMLLQKLWKENLDWDDALSGENLELFNSFTEHLDAADGLSIRRSSSGVNEIPIRTEIHAFSDASKNAYGAVIYTRDFFYARKKPRINFLMSKAKVTPNKGQWSIHRLELMAAVIAVRLVANLRDALGRQIDSVHFWSDNSAVIGWVKEEPCKWKSFVANRISEIQMKSCPQDWQFVPTKENPADLLSRGARLWKLSFRKYFDPSPPNPTTEFWVFGPKWLSEKQIPSASSIGKSSFEEAIIEARKDSVALLVGTSVENNNCLLDEAHFSSWSKAVRTVCFVLKFIRKCRKIGNPTEESSFSASEFSAASRALLRNLQLVSFRSEVESNCARISKKSKIAIFCPFVDDDGLIRCRSRLEKSGDLSFDEKFPIILDGSNYFVRLLLAWIHASKTLHSTGISTNLHHVRSEFLVLRARSSMNKVIRACKVCVKYRAKPACEVVPPLPAFRIDVCAPFSVTGVDFAGPIYVKDRTGDKVKSYIVLFVCATSRAVHLDLTPDLSTHEFLLCLRKFMSRFPSVSKIISDNASTFKRADKEFRLFWSNLKKPEVQFFLGSSKVEWEFITERSPTQGSFWERIVQLVKRPLRKALGTAVPDFRELESILAEIELCINLRPITTLPSEMCETRALCPADLVFGYHSKARFPDSSLIARSKIQEQAIILSKAWRKQQTILNGFWKRFRIEYLQHLRSAHERESKASRNVKIGDVCLLNDPSPSRGFWPLCRVVNLFGGERSDLRQRSCMIKLGNGKTVKRPISSLYPLGIAES